MTLCGKCVVALSEPCCSCCGALLKERLIITPRRDHQDEAEINHLTARRKLTETIQAVLPAIRRWYQGTATAAECRLVGERLQFVLQDYGLVFCEEAAEAAGEK